MESRVSPQEIQNRSESLAAASAPKPIETPETPVEPVAPVETPVEPKAPEAKVPEVKAPDAKIDPKVPEVKADVPMPNDTKELRKWATRASQENAQLRKDMDTLKAAIDKLSKKPVDYAALAKDPDSIKRHVEEERLEAINALQKKYDDAMVEAGKKETIFEKTRRDMDSANYPRWKQVFPMVQELANNTDGRINFQQPIGDVLDDLYKLATQLLPEEAKPVETIIPAPTAGVPAAAKTAEQSEADIQARIAEAVRKAREEAASGISAEQNGAGVGSLGKGGKRGSGLDKETLKTMPMGDLKAMISKGQ